MFSRPEIKRLLDQYVIVQLYTDRLPAKVKPPATTAEENKELLVNRFESAQLPLYVILRPDDRDGAEVARYEEGKINSVTAFAEFLKRPLNGGDTRVGMR